MNAQCLVKQFRTATLRPLSWRGLYIKVAFIVSELIHQVATDHGIIVNVSFSIYDFIPGINDFFVTQPQEISPAQQRCK